MDLNTLGQWVSDIIALLALGISIFSASRRQNRIDLERLDKKIDTGSAALDKKIDGLETRVTKLQTEINHLPNKELAHKLEIAITKLENKFDVMDERLKPVAAMAARMQEAMIEGMHK